MNFYWISLNLINVLWKNRCPATRADAGPGQRCSQQSAAATTTTYCWASSCSADAVMQTLVQHVQNQPAGGAPHVPPRDKRDQEDETINHLLISCVFARQFWYLLLRQLGLYSLSLQPSDSSFDSWWEKAIGAKSGLMQKYLNSLIVLGVLDSLESPELLLRFWWNHP